MYHLLRKLTMDSMEFYRYKDGSGLCYNEVGTQFWRFKGKIGPLLSLTEGPSWGKVHYGDQPGLGVVQL